MDTMNKTMDTTMDTMDKTMDTMDKTKHTTDHDEAKTHQPYTIERLRVLAADFAVVEEERVALAKRLAAVTDRRDNTFPCVALARAACALAQHGVAVLPKCAADDIEWDPAHFTTTHVKEPIAFHIIMGERHDWVVEAVKAPDKFDKEHFLYEGCVIWDIATHAEANGAAWRGFLCGPLATAIGGEGVAVQHALEACCHETLRAAWDASSVTRSYNLDDDYFGAHLCDVGMTVIRVMNRDDEDVTEG